MPRPAMIFAAGFGTRMGALTKDRPKPMIEVSGKPLINHSLEFLRNGGVTKIVINTHYHADLLEQHLAKEPDVQTIREEPEILETGGGLRNAMRLFGTAPVMTLNSDIVWPGRNPVADLDAAWDPIKMDALLVLIPLEKAVGFEGRGDFAIDAEGRLSRAENAPYLYTGLQIIKTETLPHYKEAKFSLSKVWDDLITERRAYGMIFDGAWVDVGKPDGINLAQQALENKHV